MTLFARDALILSTELLCLTQGTVQAFELFVLWLVSAWAAGATSCLRRSCSERCLDCNGDKRWRLRGQRNDQADTGDNRFDLLQLGSVLKYKE